jgi:hypothetical protein
MLHFLVNGGLVAAAVLIHYEALYRLTRLIPRLGWVQERYRLLVGLFGAMIAHVVEIWMFAFAYYAMIGSGRFGALQGNFEYGLMDCAYFSFTSYTTLGFGDIEPLGDIRFLVGLESLTGLVLITWTASFMFIEMQKFWEDD